ncbi:DMT family transporter [Streptomyces sp. AP-93]|uniref:DMT family transporter n=1 Tax=Streptomyces sp. AP-93 TaxID=2929048 RepID=UPI001FAEAEEA|nr:DMT family transporter [Streptomyces sp. AP-93]MCJ0874268.1 DMT family transporter [Streptomyces sp. AP-93]
MGAVGNVLVAAVLWGTVGPAQIWADTGTHPVSLGAARMLLGGLVLSLLTVRPAGLRTLTRPGVRSWLGLCVLVTAAFQVCFLQAVERSGAALATAVAFGTVPVVSGLCARLLSGERFASRWLWGTACAVAGIGLLLLPGSGSRADVLGVLCGVVAGASFGVYIAATKELGSMGADLGAAAPVSVLCAGLLVSPYLLVAPEGLGTPRAVALIGWLALGTTALGYLLFTRGVGRLSAATTGTLSLTEPLVATVLGVALLGERPGPLAAAGAGLLLGGLVLVSVPHSRRAGAEPRPEPERVAG